MAHIITRVTDKCIVLLVGKRFDIWYIKISFNDKELRVSLHTVSLLYYTHPPKPVCPYL